MTAGVSSTSVSSVSGAVAGVIAQLTQRFGERCVTSHAMRLQHANSITWHAPQLPDAVVFVETTAEVQEVVRLCAQHKVPIIAYGTGTSLEGHINAPLGGISVDLSRMNKILAVNAEDLDCVVEPGVTRKQLNAHIRDTGLFFPIDPGADASIGGMAATRASGTNAVRYGTMREIVMGLEVVLADGSVMKTGGRVKKSAAGYDLTRLIVGSEGTLGIITQVTLRLHGIPEAVSAGICSFDTVKQACDAVIATIQCGIPVARIELLDDVQVKASNLYSKLTLEEKPHLFLEFHGSAASVAEQAELFGDLAKEFGSGDFQWANEAEARSKLWTARHDSYWAALGLRPGCTAVSTDVCLPISCLADFIEETKRDLVAEGFIAPIVGHVGDGNFHVLMVLDMADADEISRAKAFVSRLNLRAIAAGGTCTGEHGIGQGKMAYMLPEHGAPALSAMQAIKTALDPQGIMNPGKIFG